MALSTLIHLGGLGGGMADSSSIVDCLDLPPYGLVQYIEGYDAFFDGRRFVVMPSAGDAREF